MRRAKRPPLNLTAEARRFLQDSIRLCLELEAEGSDLLSFSERAEEAAHGAELTRADLESALRAIDRGDLETALYHACDRLSTLAGLIGRTADGFVLRDQRARGVELAAREARRQLRELWEEVHREEACGDSGNWSRAGSSRRAVLEKIRARAKADPEERSRLFGDARAIPSVATLARRLERDAKRPRRHS